MKKLLLTLATAFVFNFASAQRSVDWSVEEIIEPTKIQSNSQGSPMPFEFVMKNNGPDMVNTGDTLGFQFLFVKGSSIVYAAPSVQGLYTTLVGKDMNVGDTMHFRGTLNMNILWNVSFNCDLVIFARVYDRVNDPMILEDQSTLNNNAKSKNIDWINQYGWGVSVENVNMDKVSIFPNPATEFVNVQFNAYDVTSSIEVSLTDVSGRVVYTNSFAKPEEVSINVSELSKGMYFHNVKNCYINSNNVVNVR